MIRRLLLPALLAVVVVGVLLFGVFPTRSLLAQRQALAERQATLDELEAEGAQLDARIAELHDPEEIEKLARRDFDLVKPGDQTFSLSPNDDVPLRAPDGWPFTNLVDQLSG